MLTFVVTFIVLTAGSFLLGFPVASYLRSKGIIDHPNARSSHATPTIRGGGLGFMSIIVCAGLFLGLRDPMPMLPIVFGAGLIGLMSFVDDLRQLGPSIRFGCHLAAASIAVVAIAKSSPLFPFAPNESLVGWAVWGVITLFWIVGYTNAFNFMDGINGIAATQAMVTGLGMALAVATASGEWTGLPLLMSVVLAGACAGFLFHNFPKARMFMGDVGSAPLGFLLAVLILWMASSHGWWLVLPLGLLHANFVLDAAITLVRRMFRRERWYEAHREHFYQRLTRAGKSHVWVTGWEFGLQSLALVLVLASIVGARGLRSLFYCGVVLIWVVFFVYAEVRFRRSQVSIKTVFPPHSDVQAV